MYLRKDIDISQFLSTVIKCEGAVFFHSETGDSLNLNSVLSAYVFRTRMAESDDWKDGIIQCQNEEDYNRLKEYLYEISSNKNPDI